jgi:hypothetical protein
MIKKFLLLQIWIVIIFLVNAAWCADKISDVQLQENGYIRIIGQPTPARLCVRISSDPKAKIERDTFREYDDEERNASLRKESGWKKEECDIRQLQVDLLFLRPCVATTIRSDDPFGDLFSFKFDAITPRFRCDYRFKIFTTLYSAEGYEIETEGQYPIAYWTDSRHTERKTEMLPGEKTWVTFTIPDNAKSWKVWVPK